MTTFLFFSLFSSFCYDDDVNLKNKNHLENDGYSQFEKQVYFDWNFEKCTSFHNIIVYDEKWKNFNLQNYETSIVQTWMFEMVYKL